MTSCCAHAHGPKHAATTGRVSKRKRAGIVALAGILMLGGGVAMASWTHSGSGTAKAQATTATPITVTPGSPVGLLYPKPATGYPTSAVGSIYATVANPNDYPVQVTSVTVGTITVTPLAGRTCAAGSVLASVPGPMPLITPITLAANSAPTALTVPGAIEMVAAAEDGCQGATFGVPVTVTAV